MLASAADDRRRVDRRHRPRRRVGASGRSTRGKSVVTANKQLIAQRGAALLRARARSAGCHLRFEGGRRRRHPHHRRAQGRHRRRSHLARAGHPQRHVQLHPDQHGERRRVLRRRAAAGAGARVRRGRSHRRRGGLRRAREAGDPRARRHCGPSAPERDCDAVRSRVVDARGLRARPAAWRHHPAGLAARNGITRAGCTRVGAADARAAGFAARARRRQPEHRRAARASTAARRCSPGPAPAAVPRRWRSSRTSPPLRGRNRRATTAPRCEVRRASAASSSRRITCGSSSRDRPGIIARIAGVMEQHDINIDAVLQLPYPTRTRCRSSSRSRPALQRARRGHAPNRRVRLPRGAARGPADARSETPREREPGPPPIGVARRITVAEAKARVGGASIERAGVEREPGAGVRHARRRAAALLACCASARCSTGRSTVWSSTSAARASAGTTSSSAASARWRRRAARSSPRSRSRCAATSPCREASAAAPRQPWPGCSSTSASPGPREGRDLLTLATELDEHADNVAAAMLGGLVTTCVLDDGRVIARAVPWPDRIRFVVASPGRAAGHERLAARPAGRGAAGRCRVQPAAGAAAGAGARARCVRARARSAARSLAPAVPRRHRAGVHRTAGAPSTPTSSASA